MKSTFWKFGALAIFAALFAFACNNQTSTNSTNSTNSSNATTNASANPTSSANTAKPDEFAATREVYTKNCVKCHKENGEGGNVEIDGENIKVPSYKTDKSIAKADEKFIEKIENGDDGMPAYKKRLSADQIKDLVKLIRHDYQGK